MTSAHCNRYASCTFSHFCLFTLQQHSLPFHEKGKQKNYAFWIWASFVLLLIFFSRQKQTNSCDLWCSHFFILFFISFWNVEIVLENRFLSLVFYCIFWFEKKLPHFIQSIFRSKIRNRAQATIGCCISGHSFVRKKNNKKKNILNFYLKVTINWILLFIVSNIHKCISEYEYKLKPSSEHPFNVHKIFFRLNHALQMLTHKNWHLNNDKMHLWMPVFNGVHHIHKLFAWNQLDADNI